MADKTRFDLEQEILDCWRITDDIQMVYEYLMEDASTQVIKLDAVANMLLGLRHLYELKFDRLFKTFEDTLKRD